MPSAVPHNIDDYEPLLVALQNALGIVVPEGQRSSLLERIEPLLATYELDSLVSLAQRLQNSSSAEIKSDVLNVISRPQPGWYLSPEVKKVLQEYIFAQLPDKARLWLVGCGQGQPAYALAMELAEYQKKSGDNKNLQIIATEASHNDIKQAESGCYGKQYLSSLSIEYKKLYGTMNNEDGSWQVKDKIRQLISFSQCDLTEDFESMGKLDLIICPDALVYFSNGVRASIVQQFSQLLKPGGILLIGNNQAIIPHSILSASHGMERVEHPAGIFYRQKH